MKLIPFKYIRDVVFIISSDDKSHFFSKYRITQRSGSIYYLLMYYNLQFSSDQFKSVETQNHCESQLVIYRERKVNNLKNRLRVICQ